MAIDAVTGLPILGLTDIIDQIPLGSQIVPFEDLQATDRPNRVPYYPDDIIPTSALVTGQDSTGRARAGRMDTGRNLYTREAVFQSNGQPIADGATAPVDVNMVGGSGGGASPITPNRGHNDFSDFDPYSDDSIVAAPNPLLSGSRLCLLDVSIIADPGDGPFGRNWGLATVHLLGWTTKNDMYFGTIPLVGLADPASGSALVGSVRYKWDYGWLYEDMGFAVGEEIQLKIQTTVSPLRVASAMLWRE